MKNVKLTLLAVLFVVFSFAVVNATNPVIDNNPLNEQVKDYIKYPEFGRENNLEGKVIVVYTITSQNQIKVEQVICKNEELGNYVKSSLDGKTVNIENEHQVVNYAISFVFEYAK